MVLMTLIWVENMVNNNIELEENKLGSTILKTKGVIVRDGGPIYITYIPIIITPGINNEKETDDDIL